jgi:hypothetical protein
VHQGFKNRAPEILIIFLSFLSWYSRDPSGHRPRTHFLFGTPTDAVPDFSPSVLFAFRSCADFLLAAVRASWAFVSLPAGSLVFLNLERDAAEVFGFSLSPKLGCCFECAERGLFLSESLVLGFGLFFRRCSAKVLLRVAACPVDDSCRPCVRPQISAREFFRTERSFGSSTSFSVQLVSSAFCLLSLWSSVRLFD